MLLYIFMVLYSVFSPIFKIMVKHKNIKFAILTILKYTIQQY